MGLKGQPGEFQAAKAIVERNSASKTKQRNKKEKENKKGEFLTRKFVLGILRTNFKL